MTRAHHPDQREIQRRLRDAGLSQNDLARAVGHTPSLFSRYLTGVRRAPADFAALVERTLQHLERAEAAAQAARAAALALPLPPPNGEWRGKQRANPMKPGTDPGIRDVTEARKTQNNGGGACLRH